MCTSKKGEIFTVEKKINFNLPYDVMIDLYEKLIIQIILYGSEIWGYEESKQVQVVYNDFLKRILKLNKSTSTCMVYGELGVKSVSEYIENRMVNFWFRLATGNDNKISTMLYKMIKGMYTQNTYLSPWLDKIKKLLDYNGMSNLFEGPGSVNYIWFKEAFKLRLNDVNRQKWQEEVKNSPACLTYRIVTL